MKRWLGRSQESSSTQGKEPSPSTGVFVSSPESSLNSPGGPMQAPISFQSGEHREDPGSLATPVLPWFLRSTLGSPSVLRGNHPCRGGWHGTGRELPVSPRQLLNLRGEIQCLLPCPSPSLLPSMTCSGKYSLFAQSQWSVPGCLGAPWESPRAAR